MALKRKVDSENLQSQLKKFKSSIKMSLEEACKKGNIETKL